MSSSTLENLKERYVNLADSANGALALFASDDFFADKARMLAPGDPQWKDEVYDEHGKWMDGWESRRKRYHGFDYCIVRLAGAGIIHAIDIDTSYFTGNYPPVASVEACVSESEVDENSAWTELMTPHPVKGDSHNIFDIEANDMVTHLKLNIFPDGGVARFRVYGELQS